MSNPYPDGCSIKYLPGDICTCRECNTELIEDSDGEKITWDCPNWRCDESDVPEPEDSREDR